MRGWCVWVTGLPGSGKSTIAKRLRKELAKLNVRTQILAMDELRRVLTPKPQYTEAERRIAYRTLAYIAKLLSDNKVNVIVDATGNRRSYRNHARRIIMNFSEAYLKCDLEECMRREAKRKRRHKAPSRIYQKALAGRSLTVPGIGVPYEPPRRPEITVETDRLTIADSATKIIGMLQKKFG